MIEIIGTGLNQWDTGRSVKVTGIDASHVHFANPGDSKAPIIELVDSEAKIPDYLLQTGKQLCVYAVANGVTIERNIFPVKKREKPADYIYTETEILTWESLDKRITQLEEGGTGGGTPESKLLVVTITGYIGGPLTSSHKAVAIYDHYKKYGNVIAYLENHDEYISLNFSDIYNARFYVHQTKDGNVALLNIDDDGNVSFRVIEHALKIDIPSVEDIIAEFPIYKGEVEPV